MKQEWHSNINQLEKEKQSWFKMEKNYELGNLPNEDIQMTKNTWQKEENEKKQIHCH